MVAAMPAATVEYWPNAGHLPWLDDPTRAAKVVTNHLRG
jgi:pimeloyl-ACP methyl ester carboxylesterase